MERTSALINPFASQTLHNMNTYQDQILQGFQKNAKLLMSTAPLDPFYNSICTFVPSAQLLYQNPNYQLLNAQYAQGQPSRADLRYFVGTYLQQQQTPLNADIQFQNDQLWGWGTGFLVRNDVVVTTARTLQYIQNLQDIRVVFNLRSDRTTPGPNIVGNVISAQQIKECRKVYYSKYPLIKGTPNLDFCLLILNSPVDSQIATPFQLQPKPSFNLSNLTISLCGYPWGITMKQIYGGTIIDYRGEDPVIRHSLSSFGKVEGSPIFYNGKVLAIATGVQKNNDKDLNYYGVEVNQNQVIYKETNFNENPSYGLLVYFLSDFLSTGGKIYVEIKARGDFDVSNFSLNLQNWFTIQLDDFALLSDQVTYYSEYELTSPLVDYEAILLEYNSNDEIELEYCKIVFWSDLEDQSLTKYTIFAKKDIKFIADYPIFQRTTQGLQALEIWKV